MSSSLEKKSGFLRFYWEALKRTSRYWLGVYIASNIIMIAFQQAVPFLTKHFLNALASGNERSAGIALVYVLSTTVLYKAFYRLWVYADRQVVPEACLKIEMESMQKVMHKSFHFFAQASSGQIQAKIKGIAFALQQLMTTVQDGFVFIVSTAVMLVAFSLQGWIPCSLAIGYVVVGVAYAVFATQQMRRFEEKKTEARVKFAGIQSDVLSQLQTITVFSSQTRETRVLQKQSDIFLAAWIKRAGLFLRTNSRLIAGSTIFEASVLVVLFFRWRAGLATVGDIALYQLLIAGVVSRVDSFARRANEIQDLIVTAEQGLALFETPEEVADAPNAKPVRVTKGGIVFSDVCFAYHNKKELVHHISCEIRSGERVAIVGRSGAGKSTILRLLLRLYDLQSGQIFIDGQPIDRVTQKSLRDAISYVPQEPLLFHRTLRENILYGNPKASEKQMIAAAKRAHCHDFISKFPEGYDSLVGERGIKLSGGERQRVAIARAILKDAPILLLDEATSALDPESEQFIQKAMEELMEKKTVIVIAHRLSTIRHVDRVLVMDEGRIIDEGSHEELLSRDSLYRDFWARQTHGYTK